jgi:1,4-dihydroxy-2-naphthoate octaprenyltransferase
LKRERGNYRLVIEAHKQTPVGAATAFVYGRFDWLYLVLALIGTVLAHAGANATADYFDFKKGVDLSRALSSHLGALAREKVEPEMILLAAFACFLITALVGLVLVYLVGWPLLLFGLAGLLGAFFYTGRPVSYKYRAMGELMLGILMGPVIVMGSYFLHTQSWNWTVFLISISLARLVRYRWQIICGIYLTIGQREFARSP